MNRTKIDNYEKMARRYIEGSAGLFDYYHYEMALPLCEPPEVEGARWMLICLTNPANRKDLEAIIRQADLRQKEADKQSLASHYGINRQEFPK